MSLSGRRRVSWLAAAPYVAATICAVLAGAATVMWSDHRAADRAALIEQFEKRLDEARSTFPLQEVTFAALDRADDQSRASGSVIWDQLAAQIHFVAFDVEPPAEGHEYCIWFVNRDGEWISAGKLPSQPNGVCQALIDLPESSSRLVRVVVTEEQADAALNERAPRPVESHRFAADVDLPASSRP